MVLRENVLPNKGAWDKSLPFDSRITSRFREVVNLLNISFSFSMFTSFRIVNSRYLRTLPCNSKFSFLFFMKLFRTFNEPLKIIN